MSFTFIKPALAKQQANNLNRQRYPLSQGCGRLLEFEDKQYINFSSNDYLGLSNNEDIKRAYIQGIELYGTGSTSSNLVTGYNKVHQELELVLADWLGGERCLLFSTGFSANSGVLSALGQTSNTSFYLDKLAHASLIDGAFKSNARSKRFRHNDLQHLNVLLDNGKQEDSLVAVEGVYSMDGDTAPLKQIYSIVQDKAAKLYIDDAHGIGILGEQGRGTLSTAVDSPANDIIQMVTFGKALATQGAAVIGDEELIDYLTNFCRDYIYSTAMPPANALATLKSIDVCKQQQWRRDKVSELSQIFKRQLDDSIKITHSQSSIIGVIVGSAENTIHCQKQLKKRGFWLTAIRPPTVENGKSRLRVTITANHNINDISALAESINEVLGECLQVN